jgi:multicomponent Na+:H+ antiporter subunit G
MSWIEILSLVLLLIGTFFMLLAGIGLLRMPDLFLRMSAATKASTLGTGFILLAAAVYFDDLGTTSRALATIVFIFLTAPIAAHRIGRAAYFDGVPLWKGTKRDDLSGHYNQRTHELESDPCDDFPAGDCEEGIHDAFPE